MYGEEKHGMQCAECEALMAEVLDGQLSGPLLDSFQAHLDQCANCAVEYAEAGAGLKWLKSLEEAEPPAHLVRSILEATIGAAPMPVVRKRKPLMERLREVPWLAPVMGTVLQPRFAMSFGMAFFSISLLLNLTGIKVNKLRNLDLRPSAIVRTYYEAQAKVARYYENIRFIYEIESRVRDLKRATTPEEKPPEQPKPKKPKETSRGPEQPQEQKRSSEQPLPYEVAARITDSGAQRRSL